jgi:hypothetical protein
MNKLEITFSARIPYNSDDGQLNRSSNIEFDLDLDTNPEEIVRQFNKFLYLNDINVSVGNPLVGDD